jgi:hypothetical protein
MRKFVLMSSLLGIACLPATAAYSQRATITFLKKAPFVIVGGVVIGACSYTKCYNEVMATAEELNSPDTDEEVVEKPKEKKRSVVFKDQAVADREYSHFPIR